MIEPDECIPVRRTSIVMMPYSDELLMNYQDQRVANNP